MGEVYRAADAKLGRDVAPKVLPSRFADDGQRFVMVQSGEQSGGTTQLNFVFNWFDEVRRRTARAGGN